MFDTIYCHIGSHKTGTTSIQDTFQSNQTVLRGSGVYFVEKRAGVLAHIARSPSRVVPGLIKSRSPEKVRFFSASAEKKLAAASAAPETHTAVLSSEDMLVLSPADVLELHRYLKTFARNLKVIYYVRHPFSRIPSLQAQAIKTGHALVEAPDARYLENYERQLGRWIDGFGKENIDVREFTPGGQVADICSAIGVEDLAEKLNIVRRNDSLSHAALLIASALNRLGPKIGNHRKLIGLLQQIKGRKYTCDPAALANLQPQIDQRLAYLNDNFGLVLQTPTPPTHCDDRNVIFDIQALASLGDVLHTTALENSRLKSEIDDLQTEIDALKNQSLG